MTVWQPYATAPRDGTLVKLRWRGGEERYASKQCGLIWALLGPPSSYCEDNHAVMWRPVPEAERQLLIDHLDQRIKKGNPPCPS